MITKVQRWSDYGPTDTSPERMPMFDPTTGERITDLYTWHVMHAFQALQPEIQQEVLRVTKAGEDVYLIIKNHSERNRDGTRYRAVVTADIITKDEPGAWVARYKVPGCTCRIVDPWLGLVGGIDDCPIHGLGPYPETEETIEGAEPPEKGTE